MVDIKDVRSLVIRAATIRILFLPHAIRQMLRPDRMITRLDVRRVIETGEIVEDYPDDPRGHSCLLVGFGDEQRPIHVVCAPKSDYLAIITAYLPDQSEWINNFKMRIRQ